MQCRLRERISTFLGPATAVVVLGLTLGASHLAAQPGPSINLPTEAAADEFDIESPGPDMGDFPNSAFTLPKGRIYLESAPFTYSAADAINPATYGSPFLLRYGLTDDVELRVLGNGPTRVDDSPEAEFGFSPVAFDTKIHLWNAQGRLIPAASLEAYVTTDWGSPAFDGGWQPSLNLNFDLPVTTKLNLECSLGYTGVRTAVVVATSEPFVPRNGHINPILHVEGVNDYQFTFAWAVEYEVTERIDLFVNGYYAGPVLQQGAGSVVGAGGFYQFTKRLMGFASCNAGCDDTVPPVAGQVGMAVAL